MTLAHFSADSLLQGMDWIWESQTTIYTRKAEQMTTPWWEYKFTVNCTFDLKTVTIYRDTRYHELYIDRCVHGTVHQPHACCQSFDFCRWTLTFATISSCTGYDFLALWSRTNQKRLSVLYWGILPINIVKENCYYGHAKTVQPYSKIGCRRTHVLMGQARCSYLQAAFLLRSDLLHHRF